MTPADLSPDPTLDLVLEREIAVPVSLVWRAWTEPELLKQWFCPAPWRVTEARLDVRPGGAFFTRMQGPEEGQEHASEGCYLEVVPERRLVWTDALSAGFRPNAESFFTGVLHLTALPDGGTRYVAMARHAGPEKRAQHEAMGFHGGWGAALDQLVALMG